MCTEEEFVNLKLMYPPRNLSEKISFTNLVFSLLQKLEQDRKAPKNFIVGKTILEVPGGDQIISFLRFLSELCLKYQLNHEFPAAKIPILKLSVPKRKCLDPHDINEFYYLSSLLDDKSPSIKAAQPEKILEASQICNIHIRIQRNKFFKRATSLFEDFDDWKKKTELIISEYLKQKDDVEGLQKKRLQLKKEMDKKYFSEMRALDRIPQVDLCNEVNKILAEINTRIKSQRIDLMLKEFIDKADGKKITDILEISAFDTKRAQKEEKSYILNDLLGKFSGSLDTLKSTMEGQAKEGSVNKHKESLDDLIAKKKKNIEFLRNKRREFLAIS